jgi:hypothetical protein
MSEWIIGKQPEPRNAGVSCLYSEAGQWTWCITDTEDNTIITTSRQTYDNEKSAKIAAEYWLSRLGLKLKK